MKKADIAVGQAYAVGSPNGMPRYWDRGLVVRLDAPRRVYDTGGWHAHFVNDGVEVRYDDGRFETLPLRRIVKPWDEHSAALSESEANDRRLEEAQRLSAERAGRVVAALAALGFPADYDSGTITMRVAVAEEMLSRLAVGSEPGGLA